MDMAAGTLAGVVEAITTGFAGVDAGMFTRASDRDLVAAVSGLEALAARLEWLRAHVVAEADGRGLPAAAGAANTKAWLAGLTRVHPGAASRTVGLALALPRYLATDAALAAGSVSAQAAGVITSTVDAVVADAARVGVVHDPQVLVKAEAALLEQAGRLSAKGLARVAARLRHVLDPTQGDGLAAAEARQVQRRELHVSPTFDGMVALNGLLDPEAGAHLLTWLSAHAGPRGTDDPRSPARRRADALVELLGHALDAGAAPIEGGERAHIAVTIDVDSLRRQVGAAGGVLDIGSVISAESTRRLACDGLILPILLGSRGEPLDVGRATRSIPRAIRRALVARDHGCAFPGCDRPPAWCHGHHIWHWSAGGPTALANLVLLCPHHHRLVHHGGWDVRINPADALPEFRAPDWVDPDRTWARQPRDPDWAWARPPERTLQPT